MKLTKVLVAVIAVGLTTGCLEKKADLKSDKGRFSYAVGYEIGRNMKRQGVEINEASFVAALRDVMSGDEKAIKLNDEERRDAMKKMAEAKREKDKVAAEGNKKTSEEFLTANKAKDGVKTTDSGLQYMVMTEGKGKKPKATDKVKVHYTGTLIDGTKFDSSVDRGKPAEFPLNAVIPGWTEGLQLMTVGSKYKFFIPPQLGYGERGNPKIPGNSALIFEVELLDILK